MLLTADVVSLTMALLVALFLAVPNYFSAENFGPFELIATAVAIGIILQLFLFIFFLNNLYKRQTFRSRYRHMALILKCILILTVLLLIVLFIFGWEFFVTSGRNFVFYFVLIAFISNSVLRLSIVKYFVFPLGRSTKSRRLLVVGSDSAARKVVDTIQQDTNTEFEVVGFVDDYKATGEPIFGNWKNLGRLRDLDSIIEKLSPDEILIAIDNAPYSRLVHIVDRCMATGRMVRVFSDRLKVLAQRLGAELYAEDIPVVMLSQLRPSTFERAIRRVADIVVSLVGLIVLSPLLLVVVVGIKISSSGPVIFRQTRIGYDGRPFDFYKFRSMHVGKPKVDHQEFVEKFIKGEAESSSKEKEINVFKMKDDPRIFPFGRFIRKTSLDEFPQLINVLKGDMGLVGPRPCLPYEWEAYDEWHKDRLKILPGCTGLWQVLGRSTVTFEDMVVMDLYYISNYSFFQDARILYQTIPTIFFGKGGF